MMEAYEIVHCRGHHHIRGLHPSTFEVTAETTLTPKGDCIVGIGAEKGAVALHPVFRQTLKREGAILFTKLSYGTSTIVVKSRGSPHLLLTHPTDIVWRKGGYIDNRTIGLWSDYVAATLPRALISHMRQGGWLTVEMTAVTPD